MLMAFFAAVYFVVFAFFIDLVFRHTLSVQTNILAVICWGIALIVSVGLAQYTVKKIKEKYEKK